MGRRNDHSREELTTLALEAGHAIVAADGIGGLTVRAVAERIGYAPGTIYNMFADFDEFVLHVNARTLDTLHDEISKVEMGDDVAANLERLLLAYFAFAQHHAKAWSAVLEYSKPDRESLPDWYAERIEKAVAVLERALAPAIAPERRHNVAVMTWAGVHGLMSLTASGNLRAVGVDSADGLARDMVRYIVMGAIAEAKR